MLRRQRIEEPLALVEARGLRAKTIVCPIAKNNQRTAVMPRLVISASLAVIAWRDSSRQALRLAAGTHSSGGSPKSQP